MTPDNEVQPTSVPRTGVPLAIIKAELADYEKQRTEAQQQAAVWQQKALLADGAFQACAALIKKLENPDEAPPAPL